MFVKLKIYRNCAQFVGSMLFNSISCPGSKACKTSDEAKKKVLDAINTKEREIW